MSTHEDHRPKAGRARRTDVARLAGVSPATVSFVLNQTAGQTISDETRQRVLQAVAELDYRPNRAAQGLRQGRSATIGFVSHDTDFGVFAASAIKGAHEVSIRHGNLLLLVNTGGSNRQAAHLVGELLDRQADALIFAVAGTRSVVLPPGAGRVPTVLLNCFVPDDSVPSIVPDEERGGREATQALLDLGHRDIAYLTGTVSGWATKARLRGFRTALRAAGLDPKDHTVLSGNYHADSGYELARTLLRRGPLPTAVMCGNDRMAVGALLALLEAGIRVPEDMSVMGYDDQFELAAEIHPALSTVRLPYDAMGRLAAEQLAAADDPALRTGRTLVHCPLVMRDSTTAPAGR
ncbi:LacI family DNA-binding transcriptional regulator [Streptomyces turgidiscabies]|uniref:LacI family DNA-binding transcriptional regulator n=1 Tax=Streptomyces TaxID=1883 RepID=UPI0005C8D780|nr:MULTISPECIES: LacI family DNA-binding transcriptional regulator [Streptomyces]MDX3491156.1 LacI family DNA-binding transcriptional regulator [Streptomyces turgidiscabies]